MKRCLVPSLFLLVFVMGSARGNGFGLSNRPVEVRYYYTPSVVYYPIVPPVYCPTPTRPVMSTLPTVPLVPMQSAQPGFAAPRAAPPSSSAEPPLSETPRGPTKSMRVGESFYDVLPGPTGMSKVGDRCSVAFWNLTAGTIALRIDGKDLTLAAGKSATMEVPSTFAWQIVGREGGATSIPAGHPTAEVLIRR